MSYRLLCDENVDPAAVDALVERGIDAVHVTERPGSSSTDETVAATATAEQRLLVTNDDDFLDADAYPNVTVLYYPENRLTAHDLANRIESLHELVPAQTDLPGVLFLTESNLPD